MTSAAISRCACLSAAGEAPRPLEKSQTITRPADASITLSDPKPPRAIQASALPSGPARRGGHEAASVAIGFTREILTPIDVIGQTPADIDRHRYPRGDDDEADARPGDAASRSAGGRQARRRVHRGVLAGD